MTKIELLAPAGDLARAKVAYRYGADAVYVGGKRFSLRARASNFELADLKEAADFAHDLGKKLYVTVNMIAHEEDMVELEVYLLELERIKVDAIIVASLYIAQLAQTLKCSYEVHLSTQLSVTNSATIAYYKSHGVDRIVLARELDLDSIAKISSTSQLPTEVFIHGGMCTNFSGRCTLSNDMTLRDANRGGCAQSCRWTYELTHLDEIISLKDNPFTMGSKDLETLDDIEDMIKAGVISFKIEGRMKSAYYIAVIVKTYRTWIDALVSGSANSSLKQHLKQEIRMAENRLTFGGFLRAIPDQNGQVYVTQEDSVVQNFIGTVLEVNGEEAIIEIRNKVSLGQTLEVFSPQRLTESFVLDRMCDETGQDLSMINKPLSKITMRIPVDVQQGDFIRRKEEQ